MVKVSEGAVRRMQSDMRFACKELEDLIQKMATMKNEAKEWEDVQQHHFMELVEELIDAIAILMPNLRDADRKLETYALLTEQYNKIDWRDF